MPMIKTSTKNELILALYGENKTNTSVDNPIGSEADLEEYAELLEVKKELDTFIMRTPRSVTEKILSFAGQSDLESA